MISTVTTTVTIVATLALGGTLGALTVFLLVSLLSTRELVTADTRATLKTFGRSLDISILPLLIIFSLIVAIEVAKILS